MTLQEIVRGLDQFEHGLAIYVVYPWQPTSNAIVGWQESLILLAKLVEAEIPE